MFYNYFHIQKQAHNWSFTIVGTPNQDIWAVKLFDLTAEEIGQLMGGN